METSRGEVREAVLRGTWHGVRAKPYEAVGDLDEKRPGLSAPAARPLRRAADSARGVDPALGTALGPT